jgi:glutamate dehydrogenase
MKAQMVKNALIVPVGAKGGFVVKRRPRAASGWPTRSSPATGRSSAACST